MNIFYLIVAYFPVLSGILGFSSLGAYAGFRLIKAKRYKVLLIIGWIGVGMTLLVYSAFFLTGYMGLGPIGN